MVHKISFEMNTVTHPPMFRRFVILVTALALCWTTLACGETPSVQSQAPNANVSTAPTQKIPSGQYPVQQATYNDGNGEYSLVLLNTPPGVPAVFRTSDLQMARLTDEEVAAKQQNYLKVDG